MKCKKCNCKNEDHYYLINGSLLCEECKNEYIDNRIINHYKYIRSLHHLDIEKDNKWIDQLYNEIEESRVSNEF